MEQRSSAIATKLEAASVVAAATAVLSGVVVLATWVWRLPGLGSLHPVIGGMSPHAASAFVLTGASVLFARAPVSCPRRVASLACAFAVILLTGVTLAAPSDPRIAFLMWGRMPTATAEAFLLFGLALALIDVGIGRWRPAEFLSFAATLIALLALVAYAFSNVSFVAPPPPARSLAFHTVLLLLAIAFAILAARPRRGLMALASSDSVAGVLVRRMLPAVVGLPALAGWLAMEAQRASWFGPGLTLPYYAIGIVLVFATMTWQTAAALHRIDMQRRRAEAQVHSLNIDLERRVAERTAQLESVNAELEAFSYSVSHDLRAPLRHIDGFATMLAARHGAALDDKGQRYLQIICDGAKNMGRMIDDLLSLGRLERQQLAMQATDLNEIVGTIIDHLQRDVEPRAIDWRCEPLPAMRCDPGLMKLVFTNLLSNAVKYSGKRDRAHISVSVRRADNEVVFAVADNGAGFDQKYHDKLFGVFQRLHRSEEFEGTGVGLATVRRIVHKHGGRIWAEAEVDRGATFFFTLPT